MAEQKAAPTEGDGGWKYVIVDSCEGFLLFFFPTVHAEIDFSKPIKFLDKELGKIAPDSAAKKRFVDTLVEVTRRDGEKELLLIHIEVQGQHDKDFARRMYQYYARLEEIHDQPIVSLALLTDSTAGFQPSEYRRETLGTGIHFWFNSVKLLNFKTEAELLADPSPFALISLVQLRAIKSGGDPSEFCREKVELTRLLLSRGYTNEEASKLFRFLDFIMKLPESLAIKYRDIVCEMKEGKKVVYETSIEQLARKEAFEQGEEQGEKRGLRESILNVLETRFGEVPEEVATRIAECDDLETLRELHVRAITVESPGAL